MARKPAWRQRVDSLSKTTLRRSRVIDTKGMRLSHIEYYVGKIYDAQRKDVKAYIDDPEQAVKKIAVLAKNFGNVNPAAIIGELARQKKKTLHIETKEYLWKRLKEEDPSLYAKYNTYVYRRAGSSKAWFFNNIKISVSGSECTATVPLPSSGTGIVYYEALSIEYDFSSDDFFAEMY